MTSEQSQMSGNMVSLAERMVFSSSFVPIYNEGMKMVEEAADYLDGQGRQESRALSHEAASLYARESMRLTTRLMQIASWLLLLRAARSGEMSRRQVALEKAKLAFDTPSAGEASSGWDELPDVFVDLVRRSLRLEERVRHMDDELSMDSHDTQSQGQDVESRNPVCDQIVLLKTAFGAS